MNKDFVLRLGRVFDGASMAVVARRLGIPHATVRNYYQGRLPAPEVLIKIAAETGVSLNWLLIGTGEMYSGDASAIDLGKFIETKISEMIDRRMTGAKPAKSRAVQVFAAEGFDVDAAVAKFNEPSKIMDAWFRHEGRKVPKDYGVVFFRGWESFSPEEKTEAIRDAKRVLDRSLSK